MSFNTLPWDKLDGDRHRSRATPSVYARWSEYRRFIRILRRRDRVLQMVPDLQGRWNIPLIAAQSIGIGRPPLRTTIISLLDAASQRGAHRAAAAATRFLNRVLRGRLRWQALPQPFELWVDGLEVPVMEELGAGTELLHETDPLERRALLRDPAFRRRFAKEWHRRFAPKAWHRDLGEPRVIDCPDGSLIGRTFADIAAERGVDPLDCFLDLQVEHGNALRWYTIVGNDRPAELAHIVSHPDVLIGFSDAGAHLRNMAYYDFPLQLLRLVRRAEVAGEPIMSIERAVHRLTGEIADFLGIDAGTLLVGDRADVVVVDPTTLDDRVDTLEEIPMVGIPGLERLVRRHDECTPLVLVGGRIAWRDGSFAEGFGQTRGWGRLLRAA